MITTRSEYSGVNNTKSYGLRLNSYDGHTVILLMYAKECTVY